jgi:predicted nucleic acid-binding protein
MRDKVFLDTNILVYTQSAVEPQKRAISLSVLEQYDCTVSTQIFNEVSNVLIKKLKMRTDDVKQIIEAVNGSCNVSIVNYDTVQKALSLKGRYGYSYYDSLILASALESDCRRVFSEDMRGGQIIENKLEIVNPYKET